MTFTQTEPLTGLTMQKEATKSATKRPKPNLHLSIPKRPEPVLSRSLSAFKSKMFLQTPSRICAWKGCTSHFLQHTHLYPEDLPSSRFYDAWQASGISSSCSFKDCFSTEPHSHTHSSITQKLLKTYQDQLMEEYAQRVLDVFEQQKAKSEEEKAEEMRAAKYSEVRRRAWAPYDDVVALNTELWRAWDLDR